jgi:hypothetical protein
MIDDYDLLSSPISLSDDSRRLWDLVAHELQRSGLLTIFSRIVLAKFLSSLDSYNRALAQKAKAEQAVRSNGNKHPDPYARILAQIKDQVLRNIDLLGPEIFTIVLQAHLDQ